MRVPAAFRDFEREFAQVKYPVVASSIAPTGEPYVVLTGEMKSGGIADLEDAATAAAQSYFDNLEGVRFDLPTLYWRSVPEYRHQGGNGGGSYYMRLLTSNKEAKP